MYVFVFWGAIKYAHRNRIISELNRVNMLQLKTIIIIKTNQPNKTNTQYTQCAREMYKRIDSKIEKEEVN